MIRSEAADAVRRRFLPDAPMRTCGFQQKAQSMTVILPQLMKYYGVTEQLRADNQLEWARQMNACVAQAEEVIRSDLIDGD